MVRVFLVDPLNIDGKTSIDFDGDSFTFNSGMLIVTKAGREVAAVQQAFVKYVKES